MHGFMSLVTAAQYPPRLVVDTVLAQAQVWLAAVAACKQARQRRLERFQTAAASPRPGALLPIDQPASALGTNRAAIPDNRPVQVNTSGEESKFGMEPNDCLELARHIQEKCKSLR